MRTSSVCDVYRYIRTRVAHHVTTLYKSRLPFCLHSNTCFHSFCIFCARKNSTTMPPKSKLARAGTMQATMQDAVSYLYPRKGSKKTAFKYQDSTTVDNMRAQGIDVPDISTGVVQDGPLPAKGKGKGGKSALKRDSTMARTVAEANRLLGGVSTGGKRTRGAKKPAAAAGAGKKNKAALKRAGTMQKTAKEGKSFLNRSKGGKGKGKGKKK